MNSEQFHIIDYLARRGLSDSPWVTHARWTMQDFIDAVRAFEEYMEWSCAHD